MSDNNGTVHEEFGAGIPLTPNLGGAQAGTTVPPTDPIANNTTPGGQEKAPNFIDLARRAVVATAMSSEGVKYIKDLKDTIADRTSDRTMAGSGIRIYPLPYPSETLAVVGDKNAFILLFSEANRKEDNLPTISLARAALESMRATLGTDIAMCNCIVVTPDDYSKGAVMGAFLVNSLISLAMPDIRMLNISSMANFQLEISTNPTVYDDFNRRFDPHAVPARDDIKLTVSLAMPKANKHNNYNLFDQASVEKMEIGTIAAYVRFTEAPATVAGQPRFLPEIHISNIVTALQADGLVPLMLALATDLLIDNKYWYSQFSNLDINGAPNIGNLINDPATGQPWVATNLAQRDTFIGTYCAEPCLMLDVMEGRARIPGIERYALTNAQAEIIATYNRFLNANVLPTTAVPCQLYVNEYTGYATIGGKNADSRWCDYLHAMIHHSSQQQLCKALLRHYQRPEEGVQIERQIFPDITLHYVNAMSIIMPDVIRAVQNEVHRMIKTVNGTQVSGAMDIGQLLSAGKGFMSNPGNVYYNAAQQQPFGQIYGAGSIQGNIF